ncbi:adenylosuccinate synthase [Candidatus Parcubacteria bacterium]|nr:MAG: adenylosuccinate synthase [Candidatus Parcubacteria bacterium]
MPAHVVVGTQWGDEAKAAVGDKMAETASIVARGNGGANAGHTVEVEGKKFIFHLLPCGIFQPNVRMNILGNGMVIDLELLDKEIKEASQTAKEFGLSVEDRIMLSLRAHVTMPYHRVLEKNRKNGSGNGSAVGATTMKAISTTYSDKSSYRGIQVCDLLERDRFIAAINETLGEYNHLLTYRNPGFRPFTADAIYEELHPYIGTIKRISGDSGSLIRRAYNDKEIILLEAAQGTMLSVEHGSYRWVSASSGTAGGVAEGVSLPPNALNRIIGVIKAYITRVGNGPFPTKIKDDKLQDFFRRVGNEYGATTGRPRDCGWLDLLIAKFAKEINGLTEAVITKIDVLDGLDPVLICTGYKHNGLILTELPCDSRLLYECVPVFKVFKGWKKTAGCHEWKEFPKEAREYLYWIQDQLQIPITMVKNGPGREQFVIPN